mmetsp:Transcript_27778/g.66949  ORF Transcript_27778/g.66949 Transcript_27778/m.66949 type:complete len:478 (+) Transcript_27778:134-1567(+)
MKLSSNIILPALLSGACLLKPVIAQQLTLGAGNACPSGYTKLTTELGCTVANSQLNLSYGFIDTENAAKWPGGCYHCDNVAGCTDGTWFNYANPGAANKGAMPICAEPGWEDGVGSVDTLFVGDSDIARWRDTNSNFPGSINVGVGGYTCDDVNSDIDAHLATYKPNKVVIVCGENDLTGQSTASEKFGDFQVVINKITASGATALYLGTKPEPSTTSLWEKYQRYDAMIFDYANTLATDASTVPVPLTVIDVHAAFVDLGNPNALYDSDRLHLSSDGYAYWNTWTTKAFDNSANGCVRWKNGVCEVTNDTTTTTTTTTSTATPATTTTTATTTIAAQDVMLAEAGVNVCPVGYTKLSTAQGCKDAMDQLDLSHDFVDTENAPKWPGGCYYCDNVTGCTDGTWFNSANPGAARDGAMPICAKQGWECADDGDWTFTNKQDRVKMCNWVANKPGKRCGRQGDNGIIARDACSVACSSC